MASFDMRHTFVRICTDRALPANVLLEQTLDKAAFWKSLEQVRRQKKIPRGKFRILIKPDLDMYEMGASTGTDPALVEHWISLLGEKGYTNVVVADADNEAGGWLDNRETGALADLLGYHYVTESGIPYDVLSLSEDLADAGFGEGSTLRGALLSNHWQQADFRILFCKNKTDEEFYYSLCLKSLIEILPQRAKGYHYYFRNSPEEVAVGLLRRNDVDFCVIDAYHSNHGIQGTRHSNILTTHTFIAGNDVLLTDWAGALKMGLDPYSSGINAYALKMTGLTAGYAIEGGLTTYPAWQNVPKLLAESVKARNRNPLLRQLSQAWLKKIDTDRFPFKNVADARINQFLTAVVQDIDQHPLAYSALVGLNYLLAGCQNAIGTFQTLYDKERIYRRQTELGFDVNQFIGRDFEEIENYILPLAQLVAHAAPDSNGLKWRYVDGSVLFEFSRVLPYDYSAFIQKVDITQSVQNMYDNIGGMVVAVKTDDQGRVIHQAERDIYLPQPNWMAVFGGEPIDVCKIEVIRYARNSQTIFWRTINSLNGSAEFDDGLVSLSARGKGHTEIKIVARQKFKLPLFWNVFNIDYVPKVKDALVSDSYARFFTRTMANFEAVFEGRQPKIGRDPDPSWGETDTFYNPLEADQVKNIFSFFTGMLEKWRFGNHQNGNSQTQASEDGYYHFSPSANGEKGAGAMVGGFLADLSRAMNKDIHFIKNQNA